jgi:cbb3-type cytochrome oxidase subunit 1
LFAASTVVGATYYVLPRIYKCRLYSRRLANIQYSLFVVGFIFFFGGFLLTGLEQGAAWLHLGLPVWTVLPGLRPYMALRASGGVLVVISFILFTYNVFATVIKRLPESQPGLRSVPATSSSQAQEVAL